MAATGGKVVWVSWAISVLTCLVFLFSAFLKIKDGPQVLQGMGHLGMRPALLAPLAVVEISCVVLYLIPATAVLGAILMTGYIGGAICTHLRVGDPFYVQIVLGILIWLGLYLREDRLKPLIPLRRP